MKFRSLVSAILPSLEKNTIRDDFRIGVGTARELIPAYKEASDFFKPSYNFKSKIVDGMMTSFEKNVPGMKKTVFMTIQELLERIVKNEAHIEGLIEKYFSEDIAGVALTYRKANIIQLVEGLEFIVKYSRKFLNYVYILESAEKGSEESGLGLADSLSPAEIKWIDENYYTYLSLFKVLYKNIDTTVHMVDNIPDILITQENDENLERTMANKIDPLSMRFIPVALNPIYYVRMLVADYQIWRHNAAKEELREIELRRVYLESIDKKERNARMEIELKRINARSQELNYKIQKMIEDANR